MKLPGVKPRWRRRFLRFVRLLALLAIGGGFVAEGALRLLVAERLRKQEFPRIYEPHERFGYRYVPGPARICVPSICKEFTINSAGYYGPEFDLEKAPGIYRIAIVAASEGTGVWLDGEESYAMVLQEHLDLAGLAVEVLNFSVDGGYRELENMRLIRESVIDYQPDLVLLHTTLPFLYTDVRRRVYRDYVLIYTSDEGSLERSHAAVDEIESHRALIAGYDASYLVRAAVRWALPRYDLPREYEIEAFIRRRYQDQYLAALPFSVVKSVRQIRETRNELQAIGGDLVLFRYRPDPEHAQMMEHFDLPYLGLDVPKTPETVHSHDGHYNSLGHQEVGAQLFEALRLAGYLEKIEESRDSDALRGAGSGRLNVSQEGNP